MALYYLQTQQGQVGQRCVLFEWMFFLWMNVVYEWMNDLMIDLFNVCYFYWVGSTFSFIRILRFLRLVWWTDQQTNRPTDMTSYRDARTHLKKNTLSSFIWLIYWWNNSFLNSKHFLILKQYISLTSFAWKWKFTFVHAQMTFVQSHLRLSFVNAPLFFLLCSQNFVNHRLIFWVL